MKVFALVRAAPGLLDCEALACGGTPGRGVPADGRATDAAVGAAILPGAAFVADLPGASAVVEPDFADVSVGPGAAVCGEDDDTDTVIACAGAASRQRVNMRR